MRKIDARHVEAGAQHVAQHLRIIRGRSESTDYLRTP
jgi:hypothetical protein